MEYIIFFISFHVRRNQKACSLLIAEVKPNSSSRKEKALFTSQPRLPLLAPLQHRECCGVSSPFSSCPALPVCKGGEGSNAATTAGGGLLPAGHSSAAPRPGSGGLSSAGAHRFLGQEAEFLLFQALLSTVSFFCKRG